MNEKIKKNCKINNIRFFEKEELYICVADIGQVANIPSIRSCLRSLRKEHPEMWIYIDANTNTGIKQMAYLSMKLLEKFISRGRSANYSKLCEIFCVKMDTTLFYSWEQRTIGLIIEYFTNEDKITQFSINKYKIDLYFPKYNLAIECDEHFHNFQKSCDKEREILIKNELSCDFIRYSPTKYNFEIKTIIKEIESYIEKKKENLAEHEFQEETELREKNDMKKKIMKREKELMEKENKLMEKEKELIEKENELMEKEKELIKKEKELLEYKQKDHRKHTQAKGDKIQRYSDDGKELLETYESMIYASRDKQFESFSAASVREAIKNKTTYKRFRWAFLNRNLDDNIVQELEETNESKEVRIGFIAMINLQKTQIEKVFPDQKTAAKELQLSSGASLSKAIRLGGMSRSKYWSMWKDCGEEMKNEYLKNNEMPIAINAVNCIRVQLLHPTTKVVLKTFASVAEVIKEFKCSRRSLKSAIDSGYVFKGYLWKMESLLK